MKETPLHTNRPAVRPASVRSTVLFVLSLSATLATFVGPTRAGAADPKSVAKCQGALAKAGAKFVAKKLATLAKCTDGVFTCIQTVDETAGAKRTACIEKARAKCAGAFGAITAARQAFLAGATKSCAGLDAAQLTGNDGLGYTAVDCTAFGGAVTDLPSLTSCLAKQHDCLASQIFQLQVPRVLELLQFTPPDAVTVAPADADALACLDATGGTGADVNDVVLGKSVAKCQKAVAKIGAKLATQRLGALAKCVDAVFVCAATKTGDDLAACNAKAKAGCTKAFAKNDDQGEAAEAATGKACGDAAVFPAFVAPEGGNLDALRPSNLATGPRTARTLSGFCSPLVTVDDYERCLIAHVFGLAEELFTFEAPRTQSLLTAIGCSIGACTPTGPPGDTAGITQILDASGDGTHPFGTVGGIAVDPQGNVYVTGTHTDNAFKITPGGGITQIIDATGDAIGHTLNAPVPIAVEANGTAYVGGDVNLFKITAGGAITQILDQQGLNDQFHFFNGPQAILVTPDHTVYATGYNSAFKITSGGTKSVILDVSGDGKQGHICQLTAGIGVDSGNNFYVACTLTSFVFKISSTGSITPALTAAGDGTIPLQAPKGLVVRGTTAYVVSFINDSVFKITADGTVSRILDATGDGVGHTFDAPTGIAVDDTDNVYVAAYGTNNVFQITPAGVITQVIDAAGDGKGHPLIHPEPLFVDGEGRIYVGGGDSVFKIVLP